MGCKDWDIKFLYHLRKAILELEKSGTSLAQGKFSSSSNDWEFWMKKEKKELRK